MGPGAAPGGICRRQLQAGRPVLGHRHLRCGRREPNPLRARRARRGALRRWRCALDVGRVVGRPGR
eukprot:4713172-Lingulodinium_polyedra.AAC.1